MSTNLLKRIIFTLSVTSCLVAQGQSKIKDGSVSGSPSLPNTNAILELESSNKGFLLPRVTLSSTSAFNPLTAHVAGITVYNTAAAGDVTPGYYYNDGTKWVRVADASAADPTKDAWVDDADNTMVKLGTKSDGTARGAGTEFVAKDDGKVGIGVAAPTAYLDVNNESVAKSGLRVRNISNSKDKQDTQVTYMANGAPTYVDANGYLFKRYNPVLSTASATTFDETIAVQAGSANAVEVVKLDGGTVPGAGILRFQIYSSLLFGEANIGANVYADITYSYGSGFQVASYGSNTGDASVNVLSLDGEGTQTLTFNFATGADLVIRNSGGKTGKLEVYHTGTGPKNLEFFQTFKSR